MKKQKILNVIIIIAVIALIGIAISVGYEQTINTLKQEEQDKISTNTSKKDNNILNNTEEEEDITTGEEAEPEEEVIGKEEENSSQEENKEKSKDDKTIDLAKKTWGNDDSVSFSIEEKKGNIYYVAVKSNATVISWYEVNTETWEISEFY